MSVLWLFVIGILGCIDRTNGGLWLLPDNEILSSYVVSAFSYFVTQHANLQNFTLVYAPPETIEKFCSVTNLEQVQDIFQVNESTILVIDFPPQGFECNWQWGHNSPNFFKYWCSIPSPILLLNPPWYPGIISNLNYGDVPENAPQDCILLETTVDDKSRPKLLADGARISLETDINESLVAYKSLGWFLFFRVFLGMVYSYLMVKSIVYRHIRKINGILNATQFRVLTLNMISCGMLAYLEFMGNKLMDKNLPAGLYLFAYTYFLGTTFAGDIWLTLMYLKVTSQQKKNRILDNRHKISTIAYIAIGIDLFLAVVVVYGSWFVRTTVGTMFSGFLALGQVAVTIFQIKETSSFVQLLVKTELRYQNHNRILYLEKKLRYCVRISVLCSIVNTILLLYYSVLGIPYKSTYTWLIFWAIMSISRIGSAFAQIHACQPPKQNRVQAQKSKPISSKDTHLIKT